MRTFPSEIIRMIGRVEVAGEGRVCAICKNYVDSQEHAEGCPVDRAFKEALKIAEEVSMAEYHGPGIIYPPGVGPATC